MDLDKYPVLADSNHRNFLFSSIGTKGVIKKKVMYQEIAANVYNLSLGDWDEGIRRYVYNIKSNNGDRDKILATVAATVIEFIKYHSCATINAKGESSVKTRLYQMGINQNWKKIKQLFVIKGLHKGDWIDFEPGRNYEAFSLTIKS